MTYLGIKFFQNNDIPIPKKLARQGVKDMLRISDGRMSGTAEGTVVLHVAPEAAAGGPLALIRNGDLVGIDVEARKIRVELTDEELEKRKQEWDMEVGRRDGRGWKGRGKRGYAKIFEMSVLQADKGADFEWLRADAEDN